jgi:Na+/proline symporter
METLGVVSVAVCVPVILLFGGLALWIAKNSEHRLNKSTEFFLSARNTQSTARTAWSFYASSVGAWVLFGPAAFTVDSFYGAGIFGLVCYAVFAGLAVVVVAYSGSFIRQRYPNSLSIGHYAKMRYGRGMEIYVAILVLLNLSIAMAAEYTGVGQLFSEVLGVSAMVPILTVGLVTLAYTAVGGLYVSIITDVYQAIFTIILLAIVVIYVAATFRPGALPPLPEYLGVTTQGLSSIATLGPSLITAAFFSDAMWQRVWAAENDKALKTGGLLGGALTTIVVFLFGFFGFLAAWAGYVTNSNTAFFSILDAGNQGPIWILIIVTLIAVTMNESAVDSLQNAIADTLTSLGLSLGIKIDLKWARVIVVLINIPIIIVGLQGYNIVSLFVVANIVTTCSALPLMFGLIPFFDDILTEFAALFSNVFALLSVMVYGYIKTVRLIALI